MVALGNTAKKKLWNPAISKIKEATDLTKDSRQG
jgi:hypothetical protein